MAQICQVIFASDEDSFNLKIIAKFEPSTFKPMVQISSQLSSRVISITLQEPNACNLKSIPHWQWSTNRGEVGVGGRGGILYIEKEEMTYKAHLGPSSW